MKFEDSYLFTALELVNRAMTEDESGVFDAEAACEIAAKQVSNLGLVQKLWDERGVKILLTAWGANRHYFIPPPKTEDEDVPEKEAVSPEAGFDPPPLTAPPSRRFGASKRTVVWPRPFNTKVVVHREGETGLEVRFGDITRELAGAAFDYRQNQLAGRQENLEAGYGRLLGLVDFSGTARVYDLFKDAPGTALEILRHIEKVER